MTFSTEDLKFKKIFIFGLVLLVVLAFVIYEVRREKDHSITGFIYEIDEETFSVGEETIDGTFNNIEGIRGRAVELEFDEETEFISYQGEEISFSDLDLGYKIEVEIEKITEDGRPEKGLARKVKIVFPRYLVDVDMDFYASENLGVSFQYPEEASVDYEDGRIKITYVGPESHMTEITDGFTLFIDAYESEVSLEDDAQREFEEATEVLELISPLEETGVAYKFSVEGGLGNEILYYVFNLDGKTIVTSQMINDPNRVGYEQMVINTILSLKPESETDECVVSGCSGEICSKEEEVSTCEYLPGMDCISLAECGEINGECGWILDEEAAECFIAVLEENPEAAETRIGYFFEKAEEIINN